jgi:hypothetical protein
VTRYVVALVLGAALRIAALPLAGTYDVEKGWSYVAATRGEAHLYRWASAPDDLSLRRIEGFDARGDYPPLALYQMGLVGRLYHRAHGGHFPQTDALTAAMKAPALLAEIGLAVVLFLLVRRALGLTAARRVTLLYWLNPAMILTTSVFGYIEPLFVLPAAGALIAGLAGWPALAGALIAAAVLTKPQAVFVAPAVALAIWNFPDGDRRSSTRSAIAGAAMTSLVIVAPIIAAGALMNMVLALGTLTLGKDMLSNACNLWWILGHVLRVGQMPGMDVSSAVTVPADVVPISMFGDFDLPARLIVRLFGSVLPLAAIAWGAWTARHARDLWLVAAAGAFFVHAYAVLATQVHENHVFAAVPLLALAAAGRPRFFPIFIAVSAIYALNMNLFYGLGEDDLRYALPRMLAGVDLTVMLALVSCATLAWHAAVLRRECAVTLLEGSRRDEAWT